MISEFGCDAIDYAFYLPSILKLCEASFPITRNEAKEILKELYKWIRDDLLPFIENLKPSLVVNNIIKLLFRKILRRILKKLMTYI